MDTEQRTYEIDYLLTPLLPDDKIIEEVSGLRKAIEDAGAFVVGEDMPKMQKLSYPIKKFDSAYFGWFRLSIKPEAINTLKNSLEKENKILRTLVTEVGKDNAMQYSRTKPIKADKEGDDGIKKQEDKPSIKPEEIDEKLNQILKEAE